MITLSNISKRFMLQPQKRSFLFKSIAGAIKKQSVHKTIWALNNISVEIKKGETVGLIGPNGSGKSTLLKIISGIYKPTSGTMTIRGKIVPILQTGIVFLPDLSVKDNIFLYGAIMGLDRKYIGKNFKKIIDFSDLSDFIDSEARTLSLGMEERLAFSVVMQVPGDILLFDETFAVGDNNFREKGLKAIREFKKENKTIILVSHDLSMVREFCDKALFLNKGQVAAFGMAEEVIYKYVNFNKRHNV